MSKEPPKFREEWSASEIKKLQQLAKENTPTRMPYSARFLRPTRLVRGLCSFMRRTAICPNTY
jgi:hypothetical protein